MSAAARAALAAAARPLLPATSAGARLSRTLAGAALPALGFADLAAVPDWLGDAARQHELSCRTALWLATPQLAATIDGAQLRALAAVAGEASIDWAMAHGNSRGDVQITPETLTGIGLAALAATLPPALACRVSAQPPPAALPLCQAARQAAEAVA